MLALCRRALAPIRSAFRTLAIRPINSHDFATHVAYLAIAYLTGAAFIPFLIQIGGN